MIRIIVVLAGCFLLCGCMDPVYVTKDGPTARLTVVRPEGLDLGIAASRVIIAYAYQDALNCRDIARIATFPHQEVAEVDIPSGKEFPMLFYVFDRNTSCKLIGGLTPVQGHHYIARIMEKPPSFWSRVKAAVVGGFTDGTCGVAFEEQEADGTKHEVPYFIMASKPVAGNDIATCDRAQRVDFNPAMGGK